jgi:beta-glucanase (GH16 family)
MKTQGKAFWTYGKIEARIKLPYGKGTWPAFWMMGENIDSVGYPQCGEVDIMEMAGGPDSDGQNGNAVVEGSFHRPVAGAENGLVSLSASYQNPDGKNFSDDFHVFGIEWDPVSIRYLVDGNTYQTVDISSQENGFETFHKPFFLLLNLAIGGDMPGSPDATTVWPQKMTVDWVRVFQKS